MIVPIHRCPNCGAPVPLHLTLCRACREQGWGDGPHQLAGDELALYLELRRGERSAAPRGWWPGEGGLERGAALLRWHVTRELGATTRAAVLARASLRTVQEARLQGWLVTRERALSVYDAFQLAFPELALRPWELPGQVPRGHWERGGDAARAEAVAWWLEQQHLSAREALALVEQYAHGLKRRLAEAGLVDLLHDRSLRALLRLVDPSIDPDPPPSARARVRAEATLTCPHCGRRLRSLAPHLTQAHPELSADERQALLAGHERLSPASLARLRQAGREPLLDTARWRKRSLAFPTTWWPANHPGVALALIDGPSGVCLQLTPDAHSPRRLLPNGRWFEVQMPQSVREVIAGAPVERACGGVRVGPLSAEGVAAVRRWLGDQPQ